MVYRVPHSTAVQALTAAVALPKNFAVSLSLKRVQIYNLYLHIIKNKTMLMSEYTGDSLPTIARYLKDIG